jgi:hypothetical protein
MQIGTREELLEQNGVFVELPEPVAGALPSPPGAEPGGFAPHGTVRHWRRTVSEVDPAGGAR